VDIKAPPPIPNNIILNVQSTQKKTTIPNQKVAKSSEEIFKEQIKDLDISLLDDYDPFQ